ncbi:MAG: ABC transporter substrate-binding protein [Inquilinaceae bacterium]
MKTIRYRLAVLTVALMGVTAPAGAETLRWAFQGDAETMDPYGRFEIFTLGFLHNIYEPLVRYDDSLAIEPALATGWETVDDLTWRFFLRRDVTFHDGASFTADDVVFSFERARKPGSAFVPTLEPVAEMVKIDDHTVEIRLARPQPILLNTLAFWFVMDEDWARANGAEDPVNLREGITNHATLAANGTGPFRLIGREPGARTVLEPFADWWDEPAHNLTRVEFQPIAADATRVAALISGEVDLVDPLPLQDVPRIESAAGLTVRQFPELRVIFLGMDQARDELLYGGVSGANPLKDPRVRLAMAQAIDVDAIVDRVLRGAARPAGLMIGPGVTGYDPQSDLRPPFDPDASKLLLAAAGYPDGFPLTLDCPNDRYVNDEAVCQALTGMLARIGIDVTLDSQSKSTYFGKILGQDTSFYLLGWTPGNLDAVDVLKPVLHSRGGGAGFFNIGGYADSRVDALTQQVETETDGAARNAMIQEAFALHRDATGHIPLYLQYVTWGMKDGMDLPSRPDGVVPLWRVRMPTGR